ncbi:MAG: PilZ domain-containing protein, partial [Planctomycetota bacterium]
EGQLLRVVIERPTAAQKVEVMKNLVELRRVVVNEAGHYIAGARFIKRTGLDRKDRRHYPRHTTSGDIFYTREGSVFTSRADVLNISQGGISIRCVDDMVMGEKLKVQLRTVPPAFTHADIDGEVSIIRLRERGRGRCDIGCVFTRMQVNPVGAEGEVEAVEIEQGDE